MPDQPKTAEEWAAVVKADPLYDGATGRLCAYNLSVKNADAIAALLVRLSNQVEAAKRLRREGHFQADMFPNSKFARLCREFDAALQEPKT